MQDCARCAKPAREWAYDHLDPHEKTDTWGGFEVRYSVNVEHYQPLCRSCHRAFDANRSRA